MAPDDHWPSWKVTNAYIFGKPSLHTTTVPSFKFLWSIVSEKSAMLKFWGLFSTNYCPLRPLTFARDNQTEHFWKALITYHHCGKFQVSVFNSDWEKCNVKVFDLFSHQLWPHMTSDLCKRVIKLCIFGKPSWHTTIMSSFKILWSIVSEKFNVKVLDLYADADTNADADDGRIPTQCVSTYTHLTLQVRQ